MSDAPLTIILCKNKACRVEVARTDGVRVYGGVMVGGEYRIASIVKTERGMIECPRCHVERRWRVKETVDSTVSSPILY